MTAFELFYRYGLEPGRAQKTRAGNSEFLTARPMLLSTLELRQLLGVGTALAVVEVGVGAAAVVAADPAAVLNRESRG